MAATDATPIEATKARLNEVQEEVTARLDALKRGAIRRVDVTRGTIRDTSLGLAYSTSASVLDGAATITRALPLGKPLAGLLEKQAGLLTERETALAAPPIANYDDLNVKQVGEALDGLGSWDLLKVRQYEEAHKSRKTVLGAVDRLLR